MKKTIVFTVILFCSSIYAKPVLNIQHWQTTKGVPVYFVRTTQLPMLDVRMIFKAGSVFDGAEYGVANLTNSMLNQGTNKLSADKIADRLATIGAQLSLATGRDNAIIDLRTLTKPKLLPQALTLLQQISTNPTFSNRNIKIVKQQILTALALQKQSPSSVAEKTFYANLYSNHPYGHSVLGTTKTVPKISRSKLIKFYQQFYNLKNLKLVLVGAITRKQAEKIANELTQRLAIGIKAPTIQNPKPVVKDTTVKVKFPANQAAILIGALGITYHNPNYFPLLVGNHILGGGILVSRLFKQIRGKLGLSYVARSSFNLLQQPGPFIITLQTKTSRTQEAITATKQVLTKFIQDGPTKQELITAKKNLLGSFALTLDSNNKITATLSTMAAYNLPINYLDTYRQNITKVTTTQIKTAFQQLFNPQGLLTVVVG